MGQKSSKTQKGDAPIRKEAVPPSIPAPNFVSPLPMLHLSSDSDTPLKQNLIKWCKTDAEAISRRLEDIVDLHDRINKRGVVYRAGKRLDDDDDLARDRLETTGQDIISTFFSKSSPRDLTIVILGAPDVDLGIGDLRYVGCFDLLAKKTGDIFCSRALEAVETGKK